MVYSMINMYLIFYLTDIIELSTVSLLWITGIVLAVRVFGGLLDPFLGVIVDNTNTRYGKFKPWIAIGGVIAALLTVFLFADLGRNGAVYICIFAVVYLLWNISYTINDISYWSMLPSLSMDQQEREEIGSVTRICANVGLFCVVAGIVPLTKIFGTVLGSIQKGYFAFSILAAAVMLVGQCITLFGVKELKITSTKKQEKIAFQGMIKSIFENDQLVCTAVLMALYVIGSTITTSFGLYYFKYVYGDEAMYSVFAVILGAAQIVALVVLPAISKHMERKTLYGISAVLVVTGYLLFFFAPTSTMLFIGIAEVMIFVGHAGIQLMMLMFFADTIEYGYWKNGKRNESITFSLQSFICKMGGAIASGVVSVTIIISGIKQAKSAADVTAHGTVMLKIAMMIVPLFCILTGFIIYLKKYKIDRKMYGQILADLKERGDI